MHRWGNKRAGEGSRKFRDVIWCCSVVAPYLSDQPTSVTFSDLAVAVLFKKTSHPESNVMLFGKWNWRASSFCRTRSPRTSDLKKNPHTQNHCVSLSIGKNFSPIGKIITVLAWCWFCYYRLQLFYFKHFFFFYTHPGVCHGRSF